MRVLRFQRVSQARFLSRSLLRKKVVPVSVLRLREALWIGTTANCNWNGTRRTTSSLKSHFPSTNREEMAQRTL